MANTNAVGAGLAISRAGAGFLAALNASVQVRALGQCIQASQAVARAFQVRKTTQTGALGTGKTARQRERAVNREVQTDLVLFCLVLCQRIRKDFDDRRRRIRNELSDLDRDLRSARHDLRYAEQALSDLR